MTFDGIKTIATALDLFTTKQRCRISKVTNVIAKYLTPRAYEPIKTVRRKLE